MYVDVLAEAASEHLRDAAHTPEVLLHELLPVKSVLQHVQKLVQPKALSTKAQTFLDHFEASNAGIPGVAAPAYASNGVEDGSEFRLDKLKSLKVAELKALLDAKGLPVGGNKSDLIERLLAFNRSADEDDAGQSSNRITLQRMTIAELKEILVSNGLKVSGKKQELIDRLLESPDAARTSSTSISDTVQDIRAVGITTSPETDTSELQESASEHILSELTVVELKNLLRSNGLKVGGNKSELIERCMANGLGV